MMETNTGASSMHCAECGNLFPVDSMIRFKNVYVCANCKPIFMQKLAEGAQINTGEFKYAGFWIRFLAQFIDGLVVLPLSIGIQLMTGVSFLQIITPGQDRPIFAYLVAQLLGLATGVAYEVTLIGRYGATVGKMAVGIKVVLPNGGKVSYLRALGRYFAKMLNIVTIYIGYIIAAFDDQKRGLHDRICNTRVIYK